MRVVCSVVSIISIAFGLAYNKNKPHETLDSWSRDMLNFNSSEKGLGLVSQNHILCMIYQEKCFSLIVY